MNAELKTIYKCFFVDGMYFIQRFDEKYLHISVNLRIASGDKHLWTSSLLLDQSLICQKLAHQDQ